MRRARSAFAALALAGTSAAFSTGVASAAPLPADATIDDLFASVTASVPAYGGSFVDEATGTLYVWATNASQHSARAAQRELAEVLPDAGLDGLKVEVLTARYDFATLKAWHDRLTVEVLGLPGAVLTDIDERVNRLLVGVEDLAAHRDAVEATVARLGIPRQAVVIEQRAPERPMTNVQDLHRPILGGIQISFLRSTSEFVCTLGFPAVRGGVQGFVTNSHCTATQGGVQGTVHYQPFSVVGGTTDATKVAQETVDPAYFTGGACPAGRRCRYSDSSFSRVDATAPIDQGAIARTASNSLEWNGVDIWTITGTAAPVVGQSVTKQGRTTGRTSGVVSQTCINVNQLGSTITMLCQAQAPYGSEGGDSGSPVFTISGTNVTLRGINWGSTTFSPIGNVTRSGELGSLTVV